MRIVMLTNISGTRNGEEWPARGGRIDVPADEARSLIDAGLATEDTAGKVESAAIAPDTARKAKGR